MFLEELPSTWTATIIDQDPEALASCPDTHAGQTIDKITGDATSRLVLDRVKLSARTMVAVMTDQDAVNLEVVRMLRTHFKVETLICMLDHIDSEAIEQAGLRSNEALHRVRATARSAISLLSETRSQSMDLLTQRGEVRVVEVLPGSAAVGRPLKELQPRQWLAAAVYRSDALIVPHGETVLESGDRVMLVGEPAVIDSVALFIHGSEPSFPGQYGANIALISDGEVARSEATLLHEQTLSEELLTLDPDSFDPRIISKEDIALAIARRQVGMIVTDDTKVELLARLGFRRSTRQAFIAATRVPVLLARSGRPYKRILIAISGDQSLNSVAIVGIDIARLCEAELTVLTVVPPSLSSSEETRAPLLELPRRVASLATMHDLEIQVRVEEGNPIERIRSVAEDYDLIVVGYSQRAYNSIFTPDVSLHLLHKTPCSVVFVPWNPAGR